MGTEQTKPDKDEVASIRSALYKLSELEIKDPKKYQGLPVVRQSVDDKGKEGVERILSLGDYVRKADYWIGLIELWIGLIELGLERTDGCEETGWYEVVKWSPVVKWTPGQYMNRYKLIDRRNNVELLLVEPRYGELVPLWVMPAE